MCAASWQALQCDSRDFTATQFLLAEEKQDKTERRPIPEICLSCSVPTPCRCTQWPTALPIYCSAELRPRETQPRARSAMPPRNAYECFTKLSGFHVSSSASTERPKFSSQGGIVTRANGNVKTHLKARRYASGRWLDARHQAMLYVDRSIDRSIDTTPSISYDAFAWQSIIRPTTAIIHHDVLRHVPQSTGPAGGGTEVSLH
ncbi:hypothetical protein CYME_CMK283C [Cyanidioschyzon merolae strain 10D]|uniref:Uncharacterized protein n=1 Tax=Cyanidioschyzon merolae (strain NIES-3377 / 10D) TaxID=280699 RepID=M1VHZ4_CYAM1|nr:hypothetical protein CYME_CMK283C [Cyanidioschyzon merolae strain 10D]BAM80623.1 hypothetical protein CYME_CMK283C [Cyanidioschyzon merolae strain 10D]|eukprot:XP_005536659.1 hypothetical protein CYME_CMK283C [Cyanidioschyzon merolae strain 10D]